MVDVTNTSDRDDKCSLAGPSLDFLGHYIIHIVYSVKRFSLYRLASPALGIEEGHAQTKNEWMNSNYSMNWIDI